MPRGVFEWLVVSIAVTIAGAYVGLALVDTDRPGPAAEQHVKPAAKTLAFRPAARPPAPSAPAALRPSARSERARPSVPENAFTITATRGDSWLSVHAGSFRGRVLFEGMLARGTPVRLRAQRLWVRFGAASNLDLAVNGTRFRLPLFGTFDAMVGPAGVRPDRRIYATSAQSP